MRGLLAAITLLSIVSATSFAGIREDVQETIARAQKNAVDAELRDGFWNFPLNMGPSYVSQYFLFRKWMKQSDEGFDQKGFQNLLLSLQLPDGSWQQVTTLEKENSEKKGNIDATIANYFALKVMGLDLNSSAMTRARGFITSHGGIAHSSLFTRIFLALFRNWDWYDLPLVPPVIFKQYAFIVNQNHFAQWVRPHVLPIAYLSGKSVGKDLGAEFHLGEIGAVDVATRMKDRELHPGFMIDPEKGHGLIPRPKREARLSDGDLRFLARKLRQAQLAHGSWGGYTSATIFSLAALTDDLQTEAVSRKIFSKGMRFLQQYYLGSGASAYLGTVCDGRYWDTILVHRGLIESGASADSLARSADFLIQAQQKNGGIPFGLDFEQAPDVDDTAEFVIALARTDRKKYEQPLRRAIQWIESMQNTDGGWGAFDRNNNGSWLLELLVKKFSDSASLFDKASADVTGHILEAYAAMGIQPENSSAMRRAIAYLRDNQNPNIHAWNGRWGVNYIYGTSAALVGLLRAGEPSDSDTTASALDWLQSVQNEDGGFGESSSSDLDENKAGLGVSTPSQTAWALQALLESDRRKSPTVERAIRYLVNQFQQNGGKWVDPSVVGTGHPGIVYLNYPSYPYSFTLMALGRYLELTPQ